jgi:hypothetical protein
MLGDVIHKGMLFSLTIPKHETEKGMFSYIDDKQIPRDGMVDLCTDGAPSITGLRAGLCTLVMNVSPSAIWRHFMLHPLS